MTTILKLVYQHNRLMTGTISKIPAVILLVFVCSCGNSSMRHGGLSFPVADSVPAGEAEKLSEEAVAEITTDNDGTVRVEDLYPPVADNN